jgi:hypothetical protein
MDVSVGSLCTMPTRDFQLSTSNAAWAKISTEQSTSISFRMLGKECGEELQSLQKETPAAREIFARNVWCSHPQIRYEHWFVAEWREYWTEHLIEEIRTPAEIHPSSDHLVSISVVLHQRGPKLATQHALISEVTKINPLDDWCIWMNSIAPKIHLDPIGNEYPAPIAFSSLW